MEGGFGWRHGKNQPTPAGIHEGKLEHVAKEGSVGFRILGVDNNMRPVDHGGPPVQWSLANGCQWPVASKVAAYHRQFSGHCPLTTASRLQIETQLLWRC